MPVAALGTVMICINDIDGNDHAIPLDNIAYVSRVDKNVSIFFKHISDNNISHIEFNFKDKETARDTYITFIKRLQDLTNDMIHGNMNKSEEENEND